MVRLRASSSTSRSSLVSVYNLMLGWYARMNPALIETSTAIIAITVKSSIRVRALSLFLNFCIFGQGFYDGCSEGVLGFSGALFSPLRRGLRPYILATKMMPPANPLTLHSIRQGQHRHDHR